MGVGEAVGNEGAGERGGRHGQDRGPKKLVTTARVSVASFKIRDGWPIGCKVTLRRDRIRVLRSPVSISLPRVRDFRGVPGRAFDGRGNYNMGITDHLPEIDFDRSMRSAAWYRDQHHRPYRRRSQGAARAYGFPFHN